MTLYTWMNRLFPNSFTQKLFLMAFLGTHVPLISFTGYVLLSSDSWSVFLNDLLLLLTATLTGTALTFFGMHHLLRPLFKIKQAMASYETEAEVSPLPARFNDEVGQVMQQVNRLVFHVSEHVADRVREAHTDTLTGALNRRGFQAKLPPSPEGCLIFIDLDRFKPLNDTLGHEAGDHALVHVARRIGQKLRQFERADDLICRWGGDEFIVYLHGVDTAIGAYILERVKTVFDEVVSFDGHVFVIEASFGSAMIQPGDNVDAVIRDADAKMYAAKLLRTDRRQCA